LLAAGASLALAACNAGPLLQTGSISPGATATAPGSATPMDRTLHIAATSARAQKCGYFFDPNALRANFLAAEAQRGTPLETIAKLGPAYDYTNRTVAGKIADSESYCSSDARTAEIKSSLQQVLAGNFEVPTSKKQEDTGGFFAAFGSDDTGPKAFNPDHIYDPLLNESPTKSVDPQ
jgi:hypothetical protein